ncbi:MAG: SDR family oxidoreductase [Trebonia sp.]
MNGAVCEHGAGPAPDKGQRGIDRPSPDRQPRRAHRGTDDERMRKILAQYPLRRLGRPEDVVPMVLLLASPLSSWTTGQIISVNGGYAMQ